MDEYGCNHYDGKGVGLCGKCAAQIRAFAESAQKRADEAEMWLRKTWWGPQEGSNIPVYRVLDEYSDDHLGKYLLSIGCPPYVPKAKVKP